VIPISYFNIAVGSTAIAKVRQFYLVSGLKGNRHCGQWKIRQQYSLTPKFHCTDTDTDILIPVSRIWMYS
jgi:hypothetical protein